MDLFVEDKLRNWGLEELIPLFEEQQIDREAFFLFKEITIKEIIPKIGPQLKFIKHYRDFIQQEISQNEDLHINITRTSTPIADVISESSEISENPETLFHDKNRQKTNQEDNFNASHITIFGQKRCINGDLIKQLMTNDVDGSIILKKQKIDSDGRHNITRIVINHLFQEYKGQIPTNAFIDASKAICTVFPEESPEIYYIPYQKKTKVSPKLLAKGRLWSRYINLKRKFPAREHLISGSDDSTESNSVTSTESLHDDDIASAMTLLHNSLDTNDEAVICAWKKTFLRRKEYFQNLTPMGYFLKFPILKQPKGYKLLQVDFEENFPDKSNKIYENWPKIAEKVNSLAVKRKLAVNEFDDITISSLKLLPYLFKPITVRGNNKKSWRPSRLEVQESFILHIQSIGELQNKLENRRQKLLKSGYCLQPFFVIVGELNNTALSYVSVDTTLYKLDSPLMACDVCFKLFFTLNTEYPIESKHVWMFLQKEVYNIETKLDVLYPALNELIADLRNNYSGE